MGIGSVRRTSMDRPSSTPAYLRREAGKFVGAQDVMGNDISQFFEPKQGKLREDAALIGNRRGQDHVKCGQAVRGHNQQVAVNLVNVADFAATQKF